MTETTQKKKKSWIWTLLFVLLNVGILLWTGLTELERKNESSAGFSDIRFHPGFLFLTIVCFLMNVLSESGKYYSLIKRLTNKSDWPTSVKITIYGRYYDNITPSGAGGQPFQIMYLRKKGMPAGASLAVPVYAFLIQQLTFVLTAGSIFLFAGHLFTNQTIKVTAYIGLFCFSLVPLSIILAAVFPKVMWKIIMVILRALAAIRIVKDPERKGEKIIAQLNEYSDALNYINRHRRLSVEMVLLSLVFQLCRGLMPFLILGAFGAEADILEVTVAAFFIQAALAIIPTPGGAGAAEASFYLVFSALPEPGLVFWAMLVWRFFSDYIFILGGIALSSYEYAEKKILARREKRRETEAERKRQAEIARRKRKAAASAAYRVHTNTAPIQPVNNRPHVSRNTAPIQPVNNRPNVSQNTAPIHPVSSGLPDFLQENIDKK